MTVGQAIAIAVTQLQRRRALEDHVYHSTNFCTICGCHAEHIAAEMRMCLTREQSKNVVAITHRRAEARLKERLAEVGLVDFAGFVPGPLGDGA